jgi:hypothetical protein
MGPSHPRSIHSSRRRTTRGSVPGDCIDIRYTYVPEPLQIRSCPYRHHSGQSSSRTSSVPRRSAPRLIHKVSMHARTAVFLTPDPPSFHLGHNPIPLRHPSRSGVPIRRVPRLSRDAGRQEAHVRHDIVTQGELRGRYVSTRCGKACQVDVHAFRLRTPQKRFRRELT